MIQNTKLYTGICIPISYSNSNTFNIYISFINDYISPVDGTILIATI